MKHYIRYISFIIATLASLACSFKENWEPVDAGKESHVEFVVRPTSFISYDLSGAQTKAFAEGLTEIEKRVENAFFLMFDINGNLYNNYVTLAVDRDNDVISSHRLKLEISNADITACVIANVPERIVREIKTLDDLAETSLSLQYATVSEAGYFGIPKIDLNYTPTSSTSDDVMCFPMVGIYKGPLQSENPTIQIPLKRLFAKMNITLSMDMGTNLLEGVLGGGLSDLFGDLFGDLQIGNTAENARFELHNYSLKNLPTQVRLAEYPKTDDGSQPTEESAWVKDAGTFENHLDMTPSVPIIYDKSHPRANQPNYPTTFSFTFYTPEYALLPEASAVDTYDGYENPERYKAILFDNTKHPISLSIEGRIHDHGGTYADVTYNVYFGEDNFDSFSLFRNNQYNNNLTIKGAGHLSKGETIDNRVEVLPLNLVEAYGQAANCYIISIPGTYELDTYKGVIKNISASSAKVSGSPVTVWNESENTITYDTEKSKDGLIVFTVDNSTGNIQPGNAVIGAKADNDIQWSWHLWFCEPDSRPDNTDYQHNYPTSGATVMNRSLGATEAVGDAILAPLKAFGYDMAIWNDGLFYQWGRKDPMVLGSDNKVANTASSGTYANSVLHPEIFYTDWTGTDTGAGWGTDKSVNDPCPPGYKVPASSIWRTNNNSTGMEDLFSLIPDLGYPYNLEANIDVSHNIVYPYVGYIGTSGSLIETVDVVDKFDDPAFSFETVALLQTEQRRYTNITMDVNLSVNAGAIWAENKKSLTYYHGTAPILELQERITLTGAYRETRTRSNALWGSWSSWSTPTFVTGGSISTADKALLMAELVLTGRTLATDDVTLTDASVPYIASGLHVRCIKE